ncbi:uncharacterized protein METZ01_LOCUS421494, partial [marine metagenome]
METNHGAISVFREPLTKRIRCVFLGGQSFSAMRHQYDVSAALDVESTEP